MPEEKSEPSEFKVVDRRSFSEDGSRREPVPPGDKPQATQPVTARPGARTAEPPLPAEPPPEEEAHLEEEAANFGTLVSYLSTTAMFQLGLLPGPGGERIPADFPNARRTIDLLEVLRQKTQGNLTAEESRMLEEVLYELQLTYVEAEQRRGPKVR